MARSAQQSPPDAPGDHEPAAAAEPGGEPASPAGPTRPAGPPGPLPTTPSGLLARLEALGIATRTVEHAPVFTVAEAKELRGQLPGGHCKSLYLRDKKEGEWLLVCLEDRRIDLKALAPRLGAKRLSFGSPERLWAALGVQPGSVTPFALVNDRETRITVVLDRAMLDETPLHYHPLVNTMTTAIAPADLLRFIEACGHRPHIVDLDAPG